jgi:predicted transcriptional regulator of viral defense system
LGFFLVVVQNPHSINIITLQTFFFGIHKVYKFIGFMLTENMKKLHAFKILQGWDKKGRYVFTRQDLSKVFFKDTPKALTESLNRLVHDGWIIRACRGVYVNPHAHFSLDGYIVEQIAKALRRGEYNYVSLESMLSEYGVISQIPIDRLTVMTTGRKGIFNTHYGVIEFTHTKKRISDILSQINKIKGRPLRVATRELAWQDLKHVGRNIKMVNKAQLYAG